MPLDEAIVSRMKEVEEAVSSLEPGLQPSAFQMMKEYILSGSGSVPASSEAGGERGGLRDALFANRAFDKPSDAVLAIAAYFYGRFGSEAFELSEIKQVAGEEGLTIPDRLDMTLKGATRNGRALFRSLGRGRYQPTTAGELVLREEFGVSKGRDRRAAE